MKSGFESLHYSKLLKRSDDPCGDHLHNIAPWLADPLYGLVRCDEERTMLCDSVVFKFHSLRLVLLAPSSFFIFAKKITPVAIARNLQRISRPRSNDGGVAPTLYPSTLSILQLS